MLIRALEPLVRDRLDATSPSERAARRRSREWPGKIVPRARHRRNVPTGDRCRRRRCVIRAGNAVPDSDVVVTPRIGITKCADWPLRYRHRRQPVRLEDAGAFSANLDDPITQRPTIWSAFVSSRVRSPTQYSLSIELPMLYRNPTS